MKLLTSIPALSLIACCCAVAVAVTGCGNGQDRTAATRKATAVIPVETAKARTQLDEAQGALKHLRDAAVDADLKPLYGALTSHSHDLDAALAAVVSSVDASVAAGKDQIRQWHQQDDSFADADLRTSSAKREGDLRRAVDALSQCNATLKGASATAHSQWSQTMAALDLDLTRAGIQTVSPVIAKLVDDAAHLRASLVDMDDKSTDVTRVEGPVVR